MERMKISKTVLVLLALLALIPCTGATAQTAPKPAVTATAPVPASTAEFLAALSAAPDLTQNLAPAPQFLTTCTSSSQCPSGQLCCYPCGIDGCSFTCMTPMNGHCPRFP
jgi:hypothetical protein